MTLPATGSKPAKPGILDRLRARYGWFDHVMRAQERYQDSKGDFFAAGITYFTVFALFPLLMVGFAAGGFVLSRQPDLLADIEVRIKSTVSGDLGQQLVNLMDAAIQSRTSVGIIGLATAAWAGLGWMANLREALSQMWGLSAASRPVSSAPSCPIWSPSSAVRSDADDHRADCAGQFGPDEACAGMAWAAGCSGCWRGPAGGVAVDVRVGLVAAVHLDHCAAAPRIDQLPQFRCAPG